MIHALWIVCKYVDLTLLYESRCWMGIEFSKIFDYAVKVCLHRKHQKVYSTKLSSSSKPNKMFASWNWTCWPPKQSQKAAYRTTRCPTAPQNEFPKTNSKNLRALNSALEALLELLPQATFTSDHANQFRDQAPHQDPIQHFQHEYRSCLRFFFPCCAHHHDSGTQVCF